MLKYIADTFNAPHNRLAIERSEIASSRLCSCYAVSFSMAVLEFLTPSTGTCFVTADLSLSTLHHKYL